MWNLFWIYEGYFVSLGCLSEDSIKVKRELGFVLMALNIRKVVAQRAENNQKFMTSIYFNRNCLFHLSRTMSRTL